MYSDLQTAETQSVPGPRVASRASGKSRRGRYTWIRNLFQGLCAISLAIASYFVISHYFVQSVQVVGSSMVPTLHDSEHYLLNRWVYHFRAPQRRDVVVIRDPAAGCYSVKRVVGIAGDSIYLKDGDVYLNGQKLNEPYLKRGMPTYALGHARDQLIMCGKDQFFVLGDNRMNSADSRVYGPVPRKNVIGMLVQ